MPQTIIDKITYTKNAVRADSFEGVTSQPLNVKLLKVKIIHFGRVNSLKIDFFSLPTNTDE